MTASLTHALGGLDYRLDATIKNHPDWTPDQQMARALSLFNGEFDRYGPTGYGQAILDCSKTIGTDIEAAYRYLWNVRQP